MDRDALLSAFPFDEPALPVSLYAHAPVLRIADRYGDWVLKQTGLVHSGGPAIGAWLEALHRLGVDVVVPAPRFAPNPRRLADGKEWVVYPFVPGHGYQAGSAEIRDAGNLLGRMHAADPVEARRLKTYETPVVRTMEWIEGQLASAEAAMRRWELDPAHLKAVAAARAVRAAPIEGLPLAGCSFDFKASNLVFGPKPTLVDPDHAARIPRLYDLAVALLLFHCDLPAAPGRVWTTGEWRAFMNGYDEQVELTPAERSAWPAVVELAWLDQAVWLLGNWPEGWNDTKERAYLASLAVFDPGDYALPDTRDRTRAVPGAS